MEYSKYETWFEKTAIERPSFDSLNEKISCDICIVGGAFTGMSAALHAVEQGKSVVLVEPSKIGYGCTGRNGGLIEGGLHTTIDDLAGFLGRLNAHNFWKSTISARDDISTNIKKYKIDCDYTKGLTKLSRGSDQAINYEDYASYFSSHFDGVNIDYVHSNEVQKIINMPSAKMGLRYQNGGAFNPLSYLFGIAKAAVKNKAQIFENSPVLSISEGEEIVVTTEDGSVTCRDLIVCGNAYMSDEDSPEKTSTVSTDYFQLVTKPVDKGLLDEVSPSRETVSGSGELSVYIQFTEDDRILFGGPQYHAVRHSSSFAKKQIKALEKLLPTLKGKIEADYLWSGPVGMPMNYVPIFSKVDENSYIAHGFNGHGVPISCYGGRVLVDAIMGDDKIFDIYARIRPVKLSKFAHHAIAKLTLMYYRLTSKLF